MSNLHDRGVSGLAKYIAATALVDVKLFAGVLPRACQERRPGMMASLD